MYPQPPRCSGACAPGTARHPRRRRDHRPRGADYWASPGVDVHLVTHPGVDRRGARDRGRRDRDPLRARLHAPEFRAPRDAGEARARARAARRRASRARLGRRLGRRRRRRRGRRGARAATVSPGRLPVRAQRGAPRSARARASPASRACASRASPSACPSGWRPPTCSCTRPAASPCSRPMRGCPAISYGWGRGHIRRNDAGASAASASPRSWTRERELGPRSSARSSRAAAARPALRRPAVGRLVRARAARDAAAAPETARTALAASASPRRPRWSCAGARPVVPASRSARHPAAASGGTRRRAHLRRRPASRRARPPCSRRSRDAGATATFFLVGEQVERWPALAAEIAAAGHEIALHGYRHRLLLRRARRGARARTSTARSTSIADATGREPTLLPAALRRLLQRRARLVRERGWRPLLWSRWGRDWGARATPRRSRGARRATSAPATSCCCTTPTTTARRLLAQDGRGAPGDHRAPSPRARASRSSRAQPVDVARDALGERRRRAPAELAARALAGDLRDARGRPAAPARARSATSPTTLAHGLGDLAHAHALVADEVVDAGLRPSGASAATMPSARSST